MGSRVRVPMRDGKSEGPRNPHEDRNPTPGETVPSIVRITHPIDPGVGIRALAHRALARGPGQGEAT
jgi:hypothetical protein